MSGKSSKPVLMLLHGAWHDAACWDELLPILQSANIQTLAPDLPGHGQNALELTKISLKVYSRYISQLIDKYNNVILLGHSMAGMLISQLAEEHPAKISHLIYLSAYIPQDRQSLFDLMQAHQHEFGKTPIEKALQYSPDKRICSIREEAIIPLFYGQCPAPRQSQALKAIRPQASLPLATKVRLSPENYGKIGKSYIRCLHDRVIPDSQYHMMLDAQPCNELYTLNADHSPFWSQTQQLAELLQQIVDRTGHY